MSEEGKSESVVIGKIGTGREERPPAAGPGEQAQQARQMRSIPAGNNCLFTVGTVSAGKSTLQHALVHRLWKDDRIKLQFWDMQSGLPQEQKQDGVLMDWVIKFDRGELPRRTPKDTFETFSVEFGMAKGKQVKLSFVEISGEHFEDMLPKPDQPDHEPRLKSEMVRLLTEKKINKYFVFVADTDRQLDAKATFQQDTLFSRILEEFKRLKLRRIRVLFLAAKWDQVDNKNLHPRQFFSRHFPNSMAALRDYRGAKVQFIRFTIGELAPAADDGSALQILRRDFEPVERVIQWVYFHTTGRRLQHYPPINETLWEKIKRLASF